MSKTKTGNKNSPSTRNPYWAARVRHHLRKGRDAADIVIRENIPASVVTQLIKEINEHQS